MMRRVKTNLLVGMALLLAHALPAQEMSWRETSHDFGPINEADGTVSYDFQFTNTGDQPLVIKQVITGCGCTSAKWSKKPYAPGAKGVVRISYRPEGRKMKEFSIPTEVFSNQKGLATLTITGTVTLAKHSYVNFFDPTQGKRSDYQPKEPQDDYEVILQRVRQQLYNATTVEKMEKGATSLMKMETAQGTWPEIDYRCFFRTNWEPVKHLTNIKQMCVAYTCPESSLYGHPVLFRAIDKALKAWNSYKPTSFNWWYNDISAPKAMADILALLEAGVQKPAANVTEGLMQMMAKSDPRKWTGANKQDIAMHHILRGCVLKNDSIVSTCVDEFFQPVCITDSEGIRQDLSFQQHNTQIYIGGYGSVFVDNIAKVAPLFTGTRFAMGGDRLKLFSEFVRGTYLNVFRGPYMDFSVCGRSVSRKGTLDAGPYTFLFRSMAELDPAHAGEVKDAEQRFATKNPSIGRTNRNKMYPISDYMLHNRQRYDFSVRAVSDRTCRSESGNGENLWGTYLGEGATCIRVTGDEYLDIFPVWEWDKIPGATLPAGEVENHYEWGVKGISKFVKGASDGLYGAMGYVMEDYGIQARKGWFMFDREVVCLGAGIEAPGTDKALSTTVNQCHLVGDVYLMDAGRATKLGAAATVEQPFQGWVWHNKVGYYFPQTSSICLKNGQQKGRWSKINFNQSGEELSMPVFNLSIAHGSKPNQAGYVYYVVPCVLTPAALTAYDPGQVEVLSNTSALQAVHHKQLDMVQAVFYEPGTLTVGATTLKADKPCVMLAKGVASGQPVVTTSVE